MTLFISPYLLLVNFLFALPAVKTIDTFGRRNLLLTTFPLMSFFLLMTGCAFWIPADNKAHLGVVALGIYLFGVVYSPGEGPVPFTVSLYRFPLVRDGEIDINISVAIMVHRSTRPRRSRCTSVRSGCHSQRLCVGSSILLCQSRSPPCWVPSSLKVLSGGMRHGSECPISPSLLP